MPLSEMIPETSWKDPVNFVCQLIRLVVVCNFRYWKEFLKRTYFELQSTQFRIPISD